jgi:hypothetical protein
MFTTRKQLERALANSKVVSKRASVRVRVEHFVQHAMRTMGLATIGMFVVAATVVIMTICDHCRKTSLWFIMPILTMICSGWIFRSMLISLRASVVHHFRAGPKADKHVEEIKSGNAQEGGNSPLTTTKSGSQKKSNKKPQKPMTIVLEAENEGTLARSELDQQVNDEQPSPRLAANRSPRGAANGLSPSVILEVATPPTSADDLSLTASKAVVSSSD